MAGGWSSFKQAMLAETGRDFEKAAFPYLRMAWPDLAYPSDLGFFDKQGIDQLVVIPGGIFPVVIQFKGFEIQSQLGKSQLDQIQKSVDSFIRSNLKTEQYILFYNNSGEDQLFYQNVGAIIETVVAAGAATSATVWSVDDAKKFLAGKLDDRVRHALLGQSAARKAEMASPFSFGTLLVKDVPFRDAVWTFGRGMGADISAYGSPRGNGLRELVVNSARKFRWTMIVGPFGIGKTTLARTLGDDAGVPVLYVPAAQLGHMETGGASEAKLWRQIAEYLGVLDAFEGLDGIDPDLAYALITDSMGRLMRGGGPLILVIDGLDENRHYSTINGLKLLVNELANTTIDVVLTTRREHFYNAYGNYRADFAQLSSSNSTKSAQLIELGEWGVDLCSEFLERVAATVVSEGRSGLLELQRRIARGELPLLSTHPLWLMMAAELTLGARNVEFDALFPLYEEWTAWKLERDFDVDRQLPDGLSTNLTELIEHMQAFMTAVAANMIEVSESGLTLREEIAESLIIALAEDIFPTRLDSQVYAVTSLLEMTAPRTLGGQKTFRFFHVSLHEFYLARWLRQGGAEQRAIMANCTLTSELQRFID
ncbi:MAG: hypothetical protein JWP59_1831 [Massilia sp.]|nr:hypothetical protein [Massilia sp.]